ncbi:MAG: hypothetical protein RL757_1816 [Bacteroidota bacterium]
MQSKFVTKYFFKNNQLIFEILLTTDTGGHTFHSQYVDYEDYLRAVALLRAQNTPVAPKIVAAKSEKSKPAVLSNTDVSPQIVKKTLLATS